MFHRYFGHPKLAGHPKPFLKAIDYNPHSSDVSGNFMPFKFYMGICVFVADG